MNNALEPAVQLALERCLAEWTGYPCCLLVHPDVRRLDEIGEQVAAQFGWPRIGLGTALSAALMPLAPEERARDAPDVVRGLIRRAAPGPVVLGGIDILFEPSLALDPLRLLRDISRHVALVVAWPGTCAGGTLAYASAQPRHAHYRTWPAAELAAACIIAL